MDDLINLTNRLKATTNIFDITGDLSSNIEQLLTKKHNGLFINYKCRLFKKQQNESTQELWKRKHQEIKKTIRKELSLENKANIKYEIFKINNDSKDHFFYLSEEYTEPQDLLDSLSTDKVILHKIFQSLISLHLKLECINSLKDDYEIKPCYLNAELYLNVTPHYHGKKLDALYPKIYFSENNELVITIHKKTFKVTQGDLIVDDTIFRTNKVSYTVEDEISATVYSNKKFMDFYNYTDCINHTQNLLVNTVQQLLNKNNISYTQRIFQPNFYLDTFLTVETKELSRKLVIIDNLDIQEDLRQILYKRLNEEFSSATIIRATKDFDFSKLDSKTNYLVLIEISKNNGSSVMVDGKPKNTFWDAYIASLKNKNVLLDYYSNLKVAWYESNRKNVLQGLNINVNKLLRELESTKITQLSHKLQKIKTELWLKESIFVANKIKDIVINDRELTLIYVRKLSEKKRGKDSFHASVINVKISNSEININNYQIINSLSKLQSICPYLKCREKLYNDSFYAFDKQEKVLLMAYNSARIPQIIANNAVDNIELAATQKDNLSRQVKDSKKIVLPYYLTSKKERYIYLEKRDNNLLYFITPRVQPNSTIEKQNLIYNILTFNKDGNILKALDQNITELYLKLFTDDILKTSEYSKSSLLEKIAKLYIEN